MAVKVEARGVTQTHEHGFAYLVKDGHLHVMTSQYSNNAHAVAVYAPEQWESAVVIPSTEGKYQD